MSVYTYKELISKAKECKSNVKKEQRTIISYKWSYYFAKALLKHQDVTKISIEKAPNPSKTHISRQMTKTTYLALAKKFVEFVEQKHRLPNYLAWKSYKISQRLYTYTFARCLVYYANYGKYDTEITVNEKVFTKPTETHNAVYDYFVKKTGKRFKYLDDFLEYCKSHYTYQFYFDDHKSNKQVIDSKSGNCTDLTQMECNMANAMGYDWKSIHTKCKISGTGHIYAKFKKRGTSNWFTRDIACIVDEKRNCTWCDVDAGKGYKIAENPQWFIENINR